MAKALRIKKLALKVSSGRVVFTCIRIYLFTFTSNMSFVAGEWLGQYVALLHRVVR